MKEHPLRYHVGTVSEVPKATPLRFKDESEHYVRQSLLDESHGSVHMNLGLNELGPGGVITPHLHSFEEGIYVFEGEVLMSIEGRSYLMGPGDYAIFQSGVEHAWRNVGSQTAQWLDMLAPQPRRRDGESDVYFQQGSAPTDGERPDLKDPRTRFVGHFSDSQLPPAGDVQMDGVRGGDIHGISLIMLVDQLLGAQHLTMFIVQFQPGGEGTVHDHPFEESYFFLSGEADGMLEGNPHTVKAGQYVWAGVGGTHGFKNNSDKPVRWLETQAPRPPAQQAFRFKANWEYLAQKMSHEHTHEP